MTPDAQDQDHSGYMHPIIAAVILLQGSESVVETEKHFC